MKRCLSLRLLAVCLSLCLFLVSPAVGQMAAKAPSLSSLPRLVRFSGVLRNPNGTPLTGVVGVTFALYSEQTGGAPLWLETQNVTADGSGHYSALLGSTKPEGLPAEMFASEQARWIGVQVSGQAEQPRVLLVSAPYALKAGDAETLGGLPPSAFMLAAPPLSAGSATANGAAQGSAPPPASSNVTTTGGTVNAIPLFSTATNIQNSAITQTGTGATAKIGIGVANPAAALDIKGGEYVRGVLTLPASGVATATKGANSQADVMIASVFNSGTATAVNQKFQLQAEPAGNNTATASGTLDLLYGSGTAAPAETGLKINNLGQITFASGQTFPGTGPGSVTSIASGAGLAGGPITSSGTLSIAPAGVTNAMLANPSLTITAGTDLTGGGSVALGGSTTLNLNLSATDARYSQLGANNTFTGAQTFNSTTVGVTGNTSNAGGEGILGANTSTSGVAYGVYGQTASGAGFGTVGINPVASGTGAGIGGQSSSSMGMGVYGINIATTGNAYGVLGSSSGSSGVGVYGIGSGSGVTGVSASSTGNGVVGINTKGGNAASFTGPVVVTGNQTLNGNLSATGAVTGSAYEIGGTLFDYGYANYQNAFLGFAGNNNATAGAGNTGVGYTALYLNTGNNNTASGIQALFENTGDNNTAVGAAALYFNKTGSSNTAIGYETLKYSSTANNNTALGYTAGPDSSVLNLAISNTTAIGAYADVSEANALVLGSINGVNGATSNVSVGIGTTAPNATLDVRDNGFGGNTFSAISGAVNNAVFGQNTSTSGLANGASFYTASPAGTAVVAVNTAGGYAGYFEGNLYVSGSLSKGSGSFKIDHPLDPANKYLYHSFVESPDMMNVYNGNITTDGSGLATVALPNWFEALNRDFRYQLTVIGQFAQAIVASEVSHNQFTVRTDKPNVKVSWQVTGIRQDAYANAHRIPVEEDKAPEDHGHYLHPELFGAGPEQGVGHATPPTATQH
jgi:hypothetical protein